MRGVEPGAVIGFRNEPAHGALDAWLLRQAESVEFGGPADAELVVALIRDGARPGPWIGVRAALRCPSVRTPEVVTALRAFADAMLKPLDEYDRDQGGELTTSLRAFLQHNARWETAAAELFVHRHTLRYRMRKVEELTGRDLSSSIDRMEFGRAVRARDRPAPEAEG